MIRFSDPHDSFTFVAVGQSLIKRDLQHYSAEGFKELIPIIRSADIAFTNFEGTIFNKHGGWPTKTGPLSVSSPIVLDTLKYMGFNVLSLSNNHAFDMGPQGILSTLEAVEKKGFMHAGIGIDKTDASRPGYLDTKKGKIALVAMDCCPQPDFVYALDAAEGRPARPGINQQRIIESLMLDEKDFQTFESLSQKLGYDQQKAEYFRLGFRMHLKGLQEFYGIRFERGARTKVQHTPDPDDLNRNLSEIRKASQKADFVLVYAHHHYWHTMWEETPLWIQDFARKCIDAGGNAFVSHGVPLLQGMEVYEGSPIFYSLGNFIFHSSKEAAYAKDSLWQSLIVSCNFDSSGSLAATEFVPVVLGGKQAMNNHRLPREAPHTVDMVYGEKVLKHFAKLSLPFGTQIEIKNGSGRIINKPQ